MRVFGYGTSEEAANKLTTQNPLFQTGSPVAKPYATQDEIEKACQSQVPKEKRKNKK